MNTVVRSPAVAGRFYPEDEDTLRETVRNLSSGAATPRKKVLAAVSPHAGYIYSGAIAGETLGSIEIPETVILLGPNHTGKGKAISLSTATWRMPMGEVPVDEAFIEDLLQETEYVDKDELAHQFEHCLEVQIPFLQMAQPKLSIVPISFSHISYELIDEVALALVEVIQRSDKDVLIVASSDMTHYEPREIADKKDHYVLKKLADMDPAVLCRAVTRHQISMCGLTPVAVALIAAIELGATKTELIRYGDSGEVTGDTEQVVGYAGVLIS